MQDDYHNQKPPEFVDQVLLNASQRGASDIYWLPNSNSIDVRFRIGGIQENYVELPVEYGTQCITRLKVLSELLTYKSRIAQDGSIRNHPSLPGVEMRVSIMPNSR